MNTGNLIRVSYLVFVGLLLAACGAPSPDASETDRVATRVAEELAVAMTLTAVAPTPTQAPTAAPPEPTATIIVPTDTPPPPTAASTEAPQVTPVPTSTPLPAPTDTPPPPEPTATPILIAVLPVDGGGGERPNLRNNRPVKDGRNILLPGFSQAQVSNPMVFRDRAVFQVEVFDDDVGTQDGDGIKNVTFTIQNKRGTLVHERTENHAGYCVFGGGEPECNVWVFADHDYRWPDGEPIANGTYDVNARINPEHGDDVNWIWTFAVELPGQSLAARINGITVQNGLYVVDFGTSGFTPQLPGQHVHFFFNTVPPEEAGVPGSGPWILYGGASPFTDYGVSDRPGGATQMCILVANSDHSVQLGTGNCVDLPQ